MSTADAHPELPLDPDADSSPGHFDPTSLLLVAVGGFAGTLARYGIGRAFPQHAGGWPTATFLANLTGAFALGLLLEVVVSAAGSARARQLRLLLGVGFCGAFTTFSALAAELQDLLTRRALGGLPYDGRALGIAYAVATLIGGFLATSAGIAVALRRRTGLA